MSGKDALGSALVTVLLLVLAPAVASAAECPDSGDLVTALSASDRRDALLCVIDAERTARAVPAVRPSAQLALAAQGHADDMVARRFFDHVTPGGSTLGDRVNATGYIAKRRDWELGEAIAWAQEPLDTTATLMRAWLASPEHRAIILDRAFRDVGIGMTAGLTDGSGRLGATAVLDFGFRTSSPTLPRWRSATSCVRMPHTSQRKRAPCASTSTHSKRSN